MYTKIQNFVLHKVNPSAPPFDPYMGAMTDTYRNVMILDWMMIIVMIFALWGFIFVISHLPILGSIVGTAKAFPWVKLGSSETFSEGFCKRMTASGRCLDGKKA